MEALKGSLVGEEVLQLNSMRGKGQWIPATATSSQRAPRELPESSQRALHQAYWPTSSRHERLSAACLVGATSDTDLSNRSNSMSIKTEITSLRLAEEMKQDSPRPMSQERHLSCRILRDPIYYSHDPEVVYLTSSERSHIL